MPRILTINESYPTDCATLLYVRDKYAEHLYFLNRGYIAYQVCLPSRYYEHRLVADIVFGGLPEGYHVHHINEITTDNQADNLQLLSPNEHGKTHNKRRNNLERVMLSCPICNAPFWRKPSQLNRSDIHYCSRRCRGLSQRGDDRPNKDELTQILTDLPNFSAIGRRYDVDGNAIRKWCRTFDLPTESDYWRNRGARRDSNTQPSDPQSDAPPLSY